MTTDLPKRPTLRLQEAVAYWQANTPTVANSVPQRHKSHVKASEVTYFLPPPAPEFADKPESDPNVIAMRELAAAEKGRNLEVDVLQTDPRTAAAHDFDCKLTEAAFAQRIRFKGKRDADDASNHEPIPFGYFSTPRGFCLDSKNIEPLPYPRNDQDIFEHAATDKDVIWYDVLVDRDDFLKWLAKEFSQLKPNAAKPPPPSPAKLNRWYERRVEDHKNRGITPSLKQDESDAKDEFPGVTREMVRKTRAKIAPANWGKRGPRGPRKSS
jgi:hypothetical protein